MEWPPNLGENAEWSRARRSKRPGDEDSDYLSAMQREHEFGTPPKRVCTTHAVPALEPTFQDFPSPFHLGVTEQSQLSQLTVGWPVSAGITDFATWNPNASMMHASEVSNHAANDDFALWIPDFTSQGGWHSFLDSSLNEPLRAVSGQNPTLNCSTTPTIDFGLPSLDHDSIETQTVWDPTVGAGSSQADIQAQPSGAAVHTQFEFGIEVGMDSCSRFGMSGIVDVDMDSNSTSEPDGSLLGDDDGTGEGVTAATTPNPALKDSKSDGESTADAICDTCFGLVSPKLNDWRFRMVAGVKEFWLR